MDKCREEFEKHYLNLPFHDSKAAQKCLDSCDFDVKQNVYIPNAKWFDDNDADEGVIYCCMLNTAYMSFQHQQAKVERAQTNAELLNEALQRSVAREEELQKRVDQQGLIIAKAMSIASDLQKSWSMFKIGKKLEQALKGEG